MARTFAYLRVSTPGQTTDNQLQEIKAAGFKVEPRRVVTEIVSGNVATAQRRGFTRLLDRLAIVARLTAFTGAGRQALSAVTSARMPRFRSASRISSHPFRFPVIFCLDKIGVLLQIGL
jgi:putative DNA-invertase from lambdoid prophage Rac